MEDEMKRKLKGNSKDQRFFVPSFIRTFTLLYLWFTFLNRFFAT
jgi:hypothetical protein